MHTQILDTPSLLAEGSKGVKKNIFKDKQPQSNAATSSCCWEEATSLKPNHTAYEDLKENGVESNFRISSNTLMGRLLIRLEYL